MVLCEAVGNLDAPVETIDIVENDEYCRVYERPLTETGLTWRELVAWWTSKMTKPPNPNSMPGRTSTIACDPLWAATGPSSSCSPNAASVTAPSVSIRPP